LEYLRILAEFTNEVDLYKALEVEKGNLQSIADFHQLKKYFFRQPLKVSQQGAKK